MDAARAAHLVELMQRDGYQALICRIPQHVLMFTSYAPVLGNSFCLISLNGSAPEVRLAVPEQEAKLLPQQAAVEVQTFTEETMERINTVIEAARQPLETLFHSAGLTTCNATIGYEGGDTPISINYAQSGVPGPATLAMLSRALPGAQWRAATPLLNELASVKTAQELAAIRRAVAVARQGFLAARAAIHPGAAESEVAAATTGAVLQAGLALPDTRLVVPHAHVMAGARAAEAHQTFNLTTNARIQRGDTVLVQMGVGIDGYWAELTRTFFAGEASPPWARAHRACLEARAAALQVIREGVSGREADAAARQVLQRAGLGAAFKHGLGHGCGFQAINHAAAPVLHPASQDVLRSGMVHNMEPAVYLEGQGGLRLNDMVVVRRDGSEVISSAIPRDLDWLVVQVQG